MTGDPTYFLVPGFLPLREAVQEQSSPFASQREQFWASLRLPLHLIFAFLHLFDQNIGTNRRNRCVRRRRRTQVGGVGTEEDNSDVRKVEVDQWNKNGQGWCQRIEYGGVAGGRQRLGWRMHCRRLECLALSRWPGRAEVRIGTYSRHACELRILGRSPTSSSSMLTSMFKATRGMEMVEGG